MKRENIFLIGILLFLIIIVMFTLILNSKENKDFSYTNNELTKFNRSTYGLNYSKNNSIINAKNNETIYLSAGIVKMNVSGKIIRMFAYNNQIPGPLIKVKEGDSIYVNFTNNLDSETTVHWHGIRLENKFDGIPGITQETVKPGESFLYKINFQDPGIYWYHPHFREDYQQELGLYGNILVIPNDSSFNNVDREEIITLSDIQITSEDITPVYKEKINQVLMGRFGNVMLINGKENYGLDVNKNEVIRFYITNTANARPFNLSFTNSRMKLVGSDGGLYQKERFVNSIVIGPSERAIVEVKFENNGEVKIKNINPIKEYTLGTIYVQNNSIDDINDFNILKEKNNNLDDYKKYIKNDPNISLKLSLDIPGIDMSHGMPMMEGMHEDKTGIEWEDNMQPMNYASSNLTVNWKIIDLKDNRSNMDQRYNFKVGDKVKIRIFNDPNSVHPMQHPIHFHGQRFLILAINDVPNDNLVWKDSVLIPSGETVDILLDITNPGDWMAHCHIAEHLEDGMMFMFNVSE